MNPTVVVPYLSNTKSSSAILYEPLTNPTFILYQSVTNPSEVPHVYISYQFDTNTDVF